MCAMAVQYESPIGLSVHSFHITSKSVDLVACLRLSKTAHLSTATSVQFAVRTSVHNSMNMSARVSVCRCLYTRSYACLCVSLHLSIHMSTVCLYTCLCTCMQHLVASVRPSDGPFWQARTCVVMAYVVMAHIVMAYIVTVHIVMARHAFLASLYVRMHRHAYRHASRHASRGHMLLRCEYTCM